MGACIEVHVIGRTYFFHRVYREVCDFALACVRFSSDLNLGPEEVDETARKATNVLLTRWGHIKLHPSVDRF